MAKKKTVKKQSEGLGDTIDKFTTATGIKAATKKITKALNIDDCGCEERRKALNNIFRYKKNTQCLLKDEYDYLKNWFAENKQTVTPIEQTELRAIFNRVFNKKTQNTSCPSCVRDLVEDLEKLYKEYIQEFEPTKSKAKPTKSKSKADQSK